MEEKNRDSIEHRADFSTIRYASCWEDADILLEALDPLEGKVFLSIASGGDNSLALLAKKTKKVVAIDFNLSQLACIELKKEAFKQLSYTEVLQFLGVLFCKKRKEFYLQLREGLETKTRDFWDHHLDLIERGIIHVGKFEHYFQTFRSYCLPLIHSSERIRELLEPKGKREQIEFYQKKWNNLRWQMIFKIFFSKHVMGKLGRDREFFKYVPGDVASRILKRVEHALTTLPTGENPYLEYIVTGNFQKNLPFYLREENFTAIRENLDALVLFQGGLKEVFDAYPSLKYDGFNLSDIFEYMSMDQYKEELERIIQRSNSKAKVAFWNMLAERKEVSELQKEITFLHEKAFKLHQMDKAFFYQSFVLGVVK